MENLRELLRSHQIPLSTIAGEIGKSQDLVRMVLRGQRSDHYQIRARAIELLKEKQMADKQKQLAEAKLEREYKKLVEAN